MTTTAANHAACAPAPLLSVLLSGERFWPMEPESLRDTGLSEPFLEALIGKSLHVQGSSSGRAIASALCLPNRILDPLLDRLKAQRLLAHAGSGPLNDYIYSLTEEGRRRAQTWLSECAYVGPAPVPLMDYVISVEAQTVADERIRRPDLVSAFHDISVDIGLLDVLGPAVNSGGGIFLYGAPGNGKSTLASRITTCFSQEIWLPHALIEGREIVKVYDPAYHRSIHGGQAASEFPHPYDHRWLRIRRPTVVVGGELTMESLDIRHDAVSHVSEAPLQLKSNCGCLLIDDFGRQRISPQELLNRWIIPLENRRDFLSLSSGKKIEVPFEQVIIFSTNLDPADLVDEAFLRRIRYRIEVTDPTEDEFRYLFQLAANQAGCEYNVRAVEHLLDKHYRPQNRPLRRCHPRDLLQQIRHYCDYHDLPLELRGEYFDRVVHTFFTSPRINRAHARCESPR
jgi:predicted ATPase with chaperone activity